MKHTLAFAFLAIILCLTAAAEDPSATTNSTPATAPSSPATPPFSVFKMPNIFPRHLALVEELKKEIANEDYAAMEGTCTEAVSLMPEDANWRYNLACAYARNGKRDEAFEQLNLAVRYGKTDSSEYMADLDLATLRRDPKFQRLLSDARHFAANPGELYSRKEPTEVMSTAPVEDENTIWNMEAGHFITMFKLPQYEKPSSNNYVRLPGAVGGKIRKWQEEGTAAGNFGDLYDNLDRGHSVLKLSEFPEMRPIRYCADAKKASLDRGVSRFCFNGPIVIGNSSTAYTSGAYWRSMARIAMLQDVPLCLKQYVGNQLYVYPQHMDYRESNYGDVFPARTPYAVIAPGSSFSDLPILKAMAVALASLRPEVKQGLLNARAMAPTLQYLLRVAQTNVADKADYLTPSAHPVVFDGGAISLNKIADAAHSMKLDALPPLAAFQVVDESPKPIPDRDFFDNVAGEHLIDTPFAVARVFRGMQRTRHIELDAGISKDLNGRKLLFHWFICQGDRDKIRIQPTSVDGRTVKIDIDYHEPGFLTPYGIHSSRVDIALVASNGEHYSAPAFLTYFFLPNEKRTYGEDDRIMKVDYASCTNKYVDPTISLPKPWVDEYEYGEDGSCKVHRHTQN